MEKQGVWNSSEKSYKTKKEHGRRVGNGKDERFGLQQRVTLVTDKYLDEFCQV